MFVPTGWLHAWVKINLVSQVSSAGRGLALSTPTGHFVIVSLLWTADIAVVFGLVAAVYRRR